MISQIVEEKGGRIKATDSVRKFSDHSSLIITVCGNQEAPSNSPRFFDTSLLSEEKGRKELLEAWVANHPLPSSPTNDLDWSALARGHHQPGHDVQLAPLQSEKAR
jgi:hypothetical protein